jgi:hypothetical protein
MAASLVKSIVAWGIAAMLTVQAVTYGYERPTPTSNNYMLNLAIYAQILNERHLKKDNKNRW